MSFYCAECKTYTGFFLLADGGEGEYIHEPCGRTGGQEAFPAPLEGYRDLPGFEFVKACERCGVMVVDPELHTTWHGRLTGPPVSGKNPST